MPSPPFTFRMPRKDREALEEMAALYGAPSAGGFLAEMVGVMCSNDMERVKAFLGRLIAKTGEQLTLKLNAAVDATQDPQKQAQAVLKAPKRRKGGKRAKRPT